MGRGRRRGARPMVEAWFVILWFTLTLYLVLDGRNFGVGALLHIVARNPMERRQIVRALGPLWPWHEVWLVAAGGVLFAAFPRILAVSFSGYYLALFLVLWSLILRGMAIEMGGAFDHRLWQSFWDFTLASSSIALALLFGVAMGNLLRGVPLDASGEFHMAFFTDFSVRGHVGLLDWYTVSLGICAMLVLSAHGATYLALKTEGPVHDRSDRAARWLWPAAGALVTVVCTEAWFVRPELITALPRRPLAWGAILIAIVSAATIVSGLAGRRERRVFLGSNAFIFGLSGSWAATCYPVMLRSTLDAEYGITASDGSTNGSNLLVALIWWPIAFALTFAYYLFIARGYRGKVAPLRSTLDHY
jgi:cytochrome bd ubiquinol oxidase subunit II